VAAKMLGTAVKQEKSNRQDTRPSGISPEDDFENRGQNMKKNGPICFPDSIRVRPPGCPKKLFAGNLKQKRKAEIDLGTSNGPDS